MVWKHSNKYDGETAVIIASGPSLDVEEFPEAAAHLERIEEAHSKGKIKVLTVNDACYLAPYGDVHYAGDNRWWRYHYSAVTGRQWHPDKEDFYCKCSGELWTKDPSAASMYQINEVKPDKQTGLCTKAGYIAHGGNSGYQCLNLAYHFGFSRILLTGIDLKNRNVDRTHKNHFFGNHPPRWGQANGVLAWRYNFRTISGPLDKRGVEVINCGLDSALDAFKRGKIEDFI